MKNVIKLLTLAFIIILGSCRKDKLKDHEQVLAGTWDLIGNTYLDSEFLPDPNPEYSSDEESTFNRDGIDSTVFLELEEIFFSFTIPSNSDEVTFFTNSQAQTRTIQKVKLVKSTNTHDEYIFKTRIFIGTEAIPKWVRGSYSFYLIHPDSMYLKTSDIGWLTGIKAHFVMMAKRQP